MKLGDIFKSEWLKCTDFDDSPRLLTIKQAALEEVRNAQTKKLEQKLVVRFEEEERGLICNVTNARSIEKIALSDDTADWPGKKVVLWNDPSASYGGSAGGIRIRPPRLKTPSVANLAEEGEEAF